MRRVVIALLFGLGCATPCPQAIEMYPPGYERCFCDLADLANPPRCDCVPQHWPEP